MATTNQQLVMQDLLTGQEMRHSIDPPVSDFTNAASVDPSEVLSILTHWHSQGMVFGNIINDNFAQDGVANLWKLNWNGYLTAKDLTPPEGGIEEPPPPLTLTSISPTSGPNTTTVTITATGTGFSPVAYIAVQNATVGPTTYVDETQISADVDLPDTPQTVQVTVIDSATDEVTSPQDFTVT
jgi:hypothetical protein